LHEVLDATAAWYRQGVSFALVHVVRVFGSAPRLPGVAMAVAASGEVVGSVSGGCIEGAVYEECLQVLENQQSVSRTYGVTDDDAFAVGLTCGGDIDVFIEPVDHERHPRFLDVVTAVQDGEPVAVATVVRGDSIGAHAIVTAAAATGESALVDVARSMLRRGTTGLAGGDDVFVETFTAPARLIVFGATDFARWCRPRSCSDIT
jgi:xanthine dehydrogenase accessory factor